jgi:hypothetical protein
VSRRGRGGGDERGEQGVDGAELGVEGEDASTEDAYRRLGWAHHRVAGGSWSQPGGDTAEVVAADAAQSVSQLVGRGEAEVADLVERRDPHRAGGAFRHDEGADGLDVAVAGLARALRSTGQRGPCCFHGVGGIRLAGAPASLAVGSIDLDHRDARGAQRSSEARPIGAGALDTDLVDGAEGEQPGEQLVVAGGSGFEALHPQQPADVVERGSHMHIEVGVDTAGHGAPGHGFYDGHRHPFCLNGQGVARAARSVRRRCDRPAPTG